MDVILTLPQRQGKLIALAAAYHLICPGTEINPNTFGNYEHGLTEVLASLNSALTSNSIKLKLTPFQVVKLNSAISSTIGRLKTYSLLHAENIQAVNRIDEDKEFDRLLQEFFPLDNDPGDHTTDLAGELVMLHRSFLPHVRQARDILEKEREAYIANQGRYGKLSKLWNKVVDLISRLK